MKLPIAIIRMEEHKIAICNDYLINVGHTFDECCKYIDTFYNILVYNSSYKICPLTKANTCVFGILYKISEHDCKINY